MRRTKRAPKVASAAACAVTRAARRSRAREMRVVHAAVDADVLGVATRLGVTHESAREACFGMAAFVVRRARGSAATWGRFEDRVRATRLTHVVDAPCALRMPKPEEAAGILLDVAMRMLARRPHAELARLFAKHGGLAVVRIDARARMALPIFAVGTHEDHVLRYDQIVAALARDPSDVLTYTRRHDTDSLTAGMVLELICAADGPFMDVCRDAAQFLVLRNPDLLHTTRGPCP
jgi:hypothetical protein